MVKIRAKAVPLPVVQESFYDIRRDGVTQSLLALVGACPEKARLRITEGLAPSRSTGALNFGDLFHRTLDGVYSITQQARDKRSAVVTPIPSNYDVAIKVVMERLYKEDRAKFKLSDPSAVQEFENNFGMAQVMAHAYFRRWETDLKDLAWVDIERVFEAQYLHPTPQSDDLAAQMAIPVRGKYDGVFRDRKKGLWLFETKTKAQIDSGAIADRLSFDLQVMLYLWSMQQVYGETPRGVIYNLVRRPLLRQGKSESLDAFLERIRMDVEERADFYFLRYTVSILPSEIKAWADKDLVSIMRRAWEWSEGNLSHRESGNCQMWNRPCEYLQACSTGDLSYLQKRDVVFPELAAIGEEE